MLPPEVGPHEGKEIELMLSGLKNVALFVEIFPEECSPSTLIENQIETIEFQSPIKNGIPVPVWIMYRQNHLKDALKLKKLYEKNTISEWNPTQENKIGQILGYSQHEIETYIAYVEKLRGIA